MADNPGSQAFADALARARMIAAKLGGGAPPAGGGGGGGGGGPPPPQANPGFGGMGMGMGMKRGAEDDYRNEPDAKRLDPFGAQLAAMRGGGDGIRTGLGIGGSGKACTEEIRIPDNLVGLIIGRGGEQISKIQTETACKVQVSPEPNPGKDRACFLQGTKECIERAKDMIMDIITTKGHGGSMGGQGGMNKNMGGPGGGGGGGTTVELMIPGAKVGLIIGKGGETIRQLQDKSGTKMYILQENMFEECDKPLRIVGEPDLVDHAKQLVLELIADTPGKSDFMSRGPPNEYGSGGGDMRGGRPHGGGGGPGTEVMRFPVPKVSVGLIIGKGGDMIKRIQVETGAKVQFDPINSNMGDMDEQMAIITGKPEQIRQAQIRIEELVETALNGKPDGPPSRGGGGGGRPFNNYGDDGGGRRDQRQRNYGDEEERFPVPGNRVGMVIGKGGETIRSINQQSGAHCEIDRSGPQDGPEKVFVIRGSRQQIEHAKELIMEKVNTLPPRGGRGGDYNQGGGGGQNWGQGNDKPQWGSDGAAGGDTTAQWAAYYAQYYGQTQAQGGAGGAAQPDYTQQWIEYLRSQGQHDQANILEQQAKAAKGTTSQAASSATPAPPGTTNGNGQAPAAAGGQSVDYSQQWAEHYRAIGKIAEAEAIENYIKANKQQGAGGGAAPPGAGQQPGPPGAGNGNFNNYYAAGAGGSGYGAGAPYGNPNSASTAPPGTEEK